MQRLLLALVFTAVAAASYAEMAPREGWSVTPTSKTYDQLIGDVKTAAKANKMGIVTEAGPTGAAKNRGVTIPGNRVIGIFNNVYAVDILALSTAAMIEAPIRMYVTENEDGTATLSYKQPTTVFAPYLVEAGPELGTLAGSLDDIFATISAQAAN